MGDRRTAYLPADRDGTEVLFLLQEAFRRRLTFAIGFSVTRNQDNCLIWNGIHHKTMLTGGSTNHGYPDATYLVRVREELAAKGVIFDSDTQRLGCAGFLVQLVDVKSDSR